MGVNVTLYTNSSDKRAVQKTLVSYGSYSCLILNDCTVESPEIILNYNSNIFNVNYAYIQYFNRYYYIENITILNGNRVKISLKVDVLMSFKLQILAQTAVIKRQQNKYNLYLDDSMFKSYNYVRVVTKAFPNGFLENPTFILSVAGG